MDAVYSLAHLEEAYLNQHKALGRSQKTIDHYEDTFDRFRGFLTETGRPQDSRSLSTETMQAFAAWLRSAPPKTYRGTTQRSIHGTHGNLKDLKAFIRWLQSEDYVHVVVKVRLQACSRKASTPGIMASAWFSPSALSVIFNKSATSEFCM